MSRQQSAAHYHNLKLANRAFKNVTKEKLKMVECSGDNQA
jgi:hypothetical protein